MGKGYLGSQWAARIAMMTAVSLITMIAMEYEGIHVDIDAWYAKIRHWHDPPPRSFAQHPPVLIGPMGAPVTVTPTPPIGNNTSVLPSPMPLILVDTQPGRNNFDGIARIGIDAHSPQTYGAGALLVNGAKLSEIYADHVVLERSGHRVLLYRQDLNKPVSGSDKSLVMVGGAQASPTERASSQDNLYNYLRPLPVYDGHEIHGYTLVAGLHAGNTFSQMGLQEGDVVTKINGQVIRDAGTALATLETLLQGATIQIQIERAGKLQALSLDGNVIIKSQSQRTTTFGT